MREHQQGLVDDFEGDFVIECFDRKNDRYDWLHKTETCHRLGHRHKPSFPSPDIYVLRIWQAADEE